MTAISAYVHLLILFLLLSHHHLAFAYTTINDAAEAASLHQAGAFKVLLDVRSTSEWNTGHLPNATFIPLLHQSKDTSRIIGCEDCAIAVYCQSGYRSKKAAEVLENEGFTNVYDVLGTKQWTDAGVVLVSDEDKEPCCDCTTCVNATTIEVYSGSGDNGSTSVAFAMMLFTAIIGAVLFTV